MSGTLDSRGNTAKKDVVRMLRQRTSSSGRLLRTLPEVPVVDRASAATNAVQVKSDWDFFREPLPTTSLRFLETRVEN